MFECARKDQLGSDYWGWHVTFQLQWAYCFLSSAKIEPAADLGHTCSKNKNQHSGQVLLSWIAKRRTWAEIEAAVVIEEAKKKQIEKNAQAVITQIAQLEGHMANKDAVAGTTCPCSHKGQAWIPSLPFWTLMIWGRHLKGPYQSSIRWW